MSLPFVIAMVGFLTAIAAVVIAVLSRHKKAATRTLRLVGEVAQVDSQLDPEGTVLVSGELWRAKSKNGGFISSHQRVRVVGFQELLLLVEVCD
jgi:membrane-bound serine protease (ClpP class)